MRIAQINAQVKHCYNLLQSSNWHSLCHHHVSGYSRCKALMPATPALMRVFRLRPRSATVEGGIGKGSQNQDGAVKRAVMQSYRVLLQHNVSHRDMWFHCNTAWHSTCLVCRVLSSCNIVALGCCTVSHTLSSTVTLYHNCYTCYIHRLHSLSSTVTICYIYDDCTVTS